MLAKQPDARPQTMAVVSQALDEILRTLGGLPAHTPTSLPARSPTSTPMPSPTPPPVGAPIPFFAPAPTPPPGGGGGGRCHFTRHRQRHSPQAHQQRFPRRHRRW